MTYVVMAYLGIELWPTWFAPWPLKGGIGYTVMASIVMASIVMAYIVMAHIVMADEHDTRLFAEAPDRRPRALYTSIPTSS